MATSTDRLKTEADFAALDKELVQLRAQVEKLAGTATSFGRGKLRRVGAGTRGRMDALLADGETMADDIGQELRLVEARALATVRERPLQSVGIALGIGFLLALLFRR